MSPERIVYWNPAEGKRVLDGAVIAVGIFDGLHLGHRRLLSDACAEADELGVPLCTVTFEVDPDEVFGPHEDDGWGKLLANSDRLEMLADFTGGTVIALPATDDVFSLSPQEFLDAVGAACSPRAFYVGVDFRFGARAAGTIDDIAAWCHEHGSRCIGHKLVMHDGAPVTATRIRGLLGQGDVAAARELLGGRAHYIKGEVIHGRGEGTGFGFATANVDLDGNEAMLPAEGVYGGYVRLDGKRHAAAINVGVAKSFKEATVPIEAHIVDFEGDIYGARVDVEFVEWLRPQRVFDSTEELIATVTDNIAWVRENLGGTQ